MLFAIVLTVYHCGLVALPLFAVTFKIGCGLETMQSNMGVHFLLQWYYL